MNLVYEFSYNAMLKAPLPIGKVAAGTRVYLEVTEGVIEGERFSGKVLGGGEWALVGSNGFTQVDVRLQGQTHDGANFYMQYGGLLESNKAVQNATNTGGKTEFDDQYFFTQPRVEIGDERYAWMNTTFFIGEGRMIEGKGVEYRVYRLAN
ncbi:MAG: DUF3237 domain-containing protein [Pseudomonadales bacterium]